MPPDPLDVPGFAYHGDFLTLDEEADLADHIAKNAARWELDYSRRAQRYGYRYNYDANTVARLGPLPDWLATWAARIRDVGWMGELADQATVQEYEPRAGITDHIDDPRCFGLDIVTLAAGPVRLPPQPPENAAKVEQLIQPRSAVVLTGEARSVWKHGIPARKSDTIGGQRLQRSRRLSITFRTVNPERIVR